MEISLFIVILVVAIFSVVQSLFGVGLLVFGTPTFLLLGASYAESVGYLLPSSILLSTLQSHGFRDKIKISRGIIIYAIPFVFLGMLLSANGKYYSIIVPMVGVIMLFLSLIRIVGVNKFSDKIKNFGRSSLIVTGVVHGVSNQGGALLTILMGSIYSDKEKIRTNIAFAYLLFALSQLIVLLWFKANVIGWMSVVYGLVTLILYQSLGKAIFESGNVKIFNLIFTGFMVIYGILLLAPTIFDWVVVQQ